MSETEDKKRIVATEQKSTQQDEGFFLKCYNFFKRLINTFFFDVEIVGPICVLIFFCEAMLLELIIIKIPYTEIDYSTYMQQISQIERGELNYSKISGDTGPIVYPAGYVFIYSFMKQLTNGMANLYAGQEAFRLVYLMTLALTFLIFIQMKGTKKVKPIVFYLLVISKRLHSIYVLRLFNDCFTTFFMLLTILLLQTSAKLKKRSYEEKSITDRNDMGLYSNLITLLSVYFYVFGLSVKMNALLYLPGLLIVLYFLNDENLLKTLGMIIFGLLSFIVINLQFLGTGKDIREAFIENAFNFSRKFMYVWSVNWKFLDEKTFLSDEFHKLLLLLHIIVLLLFIFREWISQNFTGKSLRKLIIQDGLFNFYSNSMNQGNSIIFSDNSAYYIAKILMMSNIIGVLFARSLHYQFLSWYQHSLSFLVFDSVPGAIYGVPLLLAHEWAWNIYPSTPVSSFVIIFVLFVVVAGQLQVFARSSTLKKKL